MSGRKKKLERWLKKRGNLRVELLEQQRVLASVTARPRSVYDQIFWTGGSICPDGETRRIRFVDQDGEVVNAEFSGRSGVVDLSEVSENKI